MTELEPLMRVKKYDVEERQKHLSQLYAQEEALSVARQDIVDNLEAEEKKLGEEGDIAMLQYYTNFAQVSRERVSEIDNDISALQERIEIARESVREAFAELKKIEITHGRRETELLAAISRKENDTFDEIALQNYYKSQQAQSE